MRDGFGRTITYARLSVTDRCSLRCRYCMAEEGGPWLPRLLTDGELLRICRCLASLGVTRFRVTGGEPLCRPGVAELIARIKAIPGVETVAVTTNGVELAAFLPALLDAGLDGINLSLDTLDRERFREITRRDALGRVLAGLSAALEHPELNLKVNCVAAPGREQDWLRLAALARECAVAVRFIEPMPIGLGAGLPSCSEAEVLSALEAAYGPAVPVGSGEVGAGRDGSLFESGEVGAGRDGSLSGSGDGGAGRDGSLSGSGDGGAGRDDKLSGSGPAHYVKFNHFPGKIGFISAVTRPFCPACNRVRVTADGFLRTCLYAPDGVGLLPLLDGPEEKLRETVEAAVRRKPEGHRFTAGGTVREARMNRIGG